MKQRKRTGVTPAQGERVRARTLGIPMGKFRPGRHNAITDVAGVTVGHCTVIEGSGGRREGEHTLRTGVTAVVPADDVFHNRVMGSGFVLNGAGEVAGLTQVMEWGLIETPICLTNTLSVGSVSAGVVGHMVDRYPSIGDTQDVVIPVVGECDDSWLNDISSQALGEEHVRAALSSASTGPVTEGNVGGGTGMITCDFKGGIGTSSRRLPPADGGYTVGVLVMSNFGTREELRMRGVPLGEILAAEGAQLDRRRTNYGSIIAVLATDAPLLPHQLGRVGKRVALGIGRVGSHAAHGSGEIVVAFSTANRVPRETRKMVARVKFLLDRSVNPLYQATIEATEEAILNALCMGNHMVGVDNHHAPALPLGRVAEIMKQYQKLGESLSASDGEPSPHLGRA